ncbi:hypothetical protein DQW77_13110 [Roseovarius sp. TE539]|uniref:caspase family protein n=1 Tax=Roseovarius sp. TE539 TaxID=2249812 RepID=UPI000DDCCABF|nr:caspase family protein [Roseovarius sp. TE539]RBI70887.1 hypothetical protein DQW77_13110 [Roseovarius sp. TE539]
MRIILSLFMIFSLSAPAVAAKYAFVLANGSYEELEDLQNTHADADAYGAAFEQLGFTVLHHRDLTRNQTIAALDGFLNRLRPGDQAAFVFSGHGWSDGSVNYLVPTDAPKKGSTRLLKRQSVALRNGLSGVLDELEALGVGLTVAVIDACRDNPFKPAQGSRSVGLSRGLARVSPPQGTFVIFSAGEGQQALDRLPDDPPDQRLSVFSRVFVPHLTSGVTLEDAISATQAETARLALEFNGHQQHPAYYDQTLGSTCLKGDCRTTGQNAITAAPDTASGACDALYEEAKSERACFVYDAYAKSCPNHVFHSIARSFMNRNCGGPDPAGQVAAVPRSDIPETIAPLPRTAEPAAPAAEDVHESQETRPDAATQETEAALRLSNAERREIQHRLRLARHDPGGADGVFGPMTRAAITSWQTAKQLHVSGYLNADQLDRLKAGTAAAYAGFLEAQRIRETQRAARKRQTFTAKPAAPVSVAAPAPAPAPVQKAAPARKPKRKLPLRLQRK